MEKTLRDAIFRSVPLECVKLTVTGNSRVPHVVVHLKGNEAMHERLLTYN